MTKTLVTGINGFTGRYLAQRLLSAGHEVHGLARSDDSSLIDPAITLHVGELLDEERLSTIVAEVEPDYVVHLAAIAFVAHGELDEMYRTNILGTRALLEACARAPKAPRSVLVASSANIYGNATSGTISESAPTAPANDYAVTKVAVENVAAIYGARLPIIVTRPFNYTGLGQSESFLIPKIVSHIRRRAPEIELGNLDVSRDFSDVRSVVDAYLRLLDAPEAIGGTFNVCSGGTVSLREVITHASRIADHDIEVRVNPDFVRANEVRLLQGSKQRLESVIGPLDVPSFEDTLRWMIEA